MTQNPVRASVHLEPRPKAPATPDTSSLAAIASATPPPLSHESSHVQKSDLKKAHVDTSDNATATFIRRVLCQNHQHHVGNEKDRAAARPINELLPPLTSSNDVDLQLYAFIAIIIKDFVYSWYSKITPDQGFVDEVIQIIAHCSRALEQRLRNVDIEALVLDEIPQLLEAHIVAYRTAHYPLHPDPMAPEPLQLYHALHPHPALSPVPIPEDPAAVLEQETNEIAYRQLLVQGALAVLLPTEDLENACLRTLIVEVIGETVVGNGIGGKGSQSWLIWEGIRKMGEYVHRRLGRTERGFEVNEPTKSRLEHFGLLSTTPMDDITRPNSRTSIHIGSAVSKIAWRVVYLAFVAFVTLRFIVVALVTSSSLPPRSLKTCPPSRKSSYSEKDQPPSDHSGEPFIRPQQRPLQSKQPILSMKSWSCISHLLELDSRMPWLSGFLSFVQWMAITGPGKVGNTNGTLDKYLSHTLLTNLLTPTNLPPFLLTIRTTLFPNNTLAPSLPAPSPSEITAIKFSCATTLLSLLPRSVANIYFATADVKEQKREVEEVLDVFGDEYCNKHLIYGILECVVVRLMPELGDVGIRELMEGRLG
ncbi:MAG: hypothetical protein M1836_007409 [Candelina mexicana]|nr:MAG: hypothetical protein M1836_007409 [Candelina mexicana]